MIDKQAMTSCLAKSPREPKHAAAACRADTSSKDTTTVVQVAAKVKVTASNEDTGLRLINEVKSAPA